VQGLKTEKRNRKKNRKKVPGTNNGHLPKVSV
jgi:hypothetical protein